MRERSKTLTETALKTEEKPKERRGTQTERREKSKNSLKFGDLHCS